MALVTDPTFTALAASRFWERKSLKDMSTPEWEALCDGCGKCCLILLEDEETGDYAETRLSCRLFDAQTRCCKRYEERHRLVPDCVKVTPDNADRLDWMPKSCAYRRLAEGRGLASWHPLISGRRESVAEAGIAVPDDLVSEGDIDPDDYWAFITGPRD